MTTTFDLDKHNRGEAGEELNRTVSWNEGVCISSPVGVTHHATIIIIRCDFPFSAWNCGPPRSRRILGCPGLG